MMRLIAIICALFTCTLCSAAPHAVIICGSGGEETYIEKFPDWGIRLAQTLSNSAGMESAGVTLLTETGSEEMASGTSDLESIEATFAKLGETLEASDPLFVFLIGHGSYQRESAKLNIPGPDIDASKLNEFISACASNVAVIINGSSTSAAFINRLSAPGRIIATATKNVEERNATEFMEQFILALADGSADMNRDDRVSVLELCTQAAELTEAWYLSEGFIATEHALIDDNGDGFGTRLVRAPDAEPDEEKIDADAKGLDGDFADEIFIADFRFPPHTDPSLRAKYLAELDAVKAHKARKAEMDADAYYDELENLLIQAARTNRQLRNSAIATDDDHE